MKHTTSHSRGAIASLIKQYRTDACIGLREMARRTNLSPTSISQLEHWSGHGIQPVSDVNLCKIVAECGADIDAFCRLAGIVPPDVLRIIREIPDTWSAVRSYEIKAKPKAPHEMEPQHYREYLNCFEDCFE